MAFPVEDPATVELFFEAWEDKVEPNEKLPKEGAVDLAASNLKPPPRAVAGMELAIVVEMVLALTVGWDNVLAPKLNPPNVLLETG